MNDRDRAPELLVACLCASWCTTCGEFRDTFERLRQANGAAKFVWLDVEGDSALMGEIEVESFPTLAVFRGDQPLFYGRVVDFFDMDFFDINLFGYQLTRWPVFNIADACVTVGVVLLLLFHSTGAPELRGDQPASVPPPPPPAL